jgi:hypothetical protein
MQERGELLPPDDALDIARRVKETYCYTSSDIVKVLCCLELMSWFYVFCPLLPNDHKYIIQWNSWDLNFLHVSQNLKYILSAEITIEMCLFCHGTGLHAAYIFLCYFNND